MLQIVVPILNLVTANNILTNAKTQAVVIQSDEISIGISVAWVFPLLTYSIIFSELTG